MPRDTGTDGILVDPAVSRAKFAREVERFQAQRDQHSRRGCWLVRAEFPTAFVVFAAEKTQPQCVMFGARIDFTNYDLVPPSVRLANPFTQELLKSNQTQLRLLRRVPVPPPPEVAAQGALPGEQLQNLLQSYGPEELPFVCLQGIREYHEHPLHSNDPWLPRRRGGEGTLNFLVEQLWRYGVSQVSGINFGIQVVPSGYQLAEVPT